MSRENVMVQLTGRGGCGAAGELKPPAKLGGAVAANMMEFGYDG